MESGASWVKVLEWITAFIHLFTGREKWYNQVTYSTHMALNNLTFREGNILKKTMEKSTQDT